MKLHLNKHLITTFILIFICSTLSFCGAKIFKAGDLISADMFNELFESLNNINNGFQSPDELLGQWKCEHVEINPRCLSSGYYTQHDNSSYGTVTDIITFEKSGTNNYTFRSQNYMIDCCMCETGNPTQDFPRVQSGAYAVIANRLIFQANSPSVSKRLTNLQRTSQTQFTWEVSNSSPVMHLLNCNKLNVTSKSPTSLDYSRVSSSVVLNWKDNSDDETGVYVTRKDSLEASYNNIATLSLDSTSYTDVLSHYGTYWYRVKSFNNSGVSEGSNVVRVDWSVPNSNSSSSTPPSSSTSSSSSTTGF
ncbi:MAG: fibronectin type III domain-containing protein [Candidatus Cloacimonetes bacterium]|nr:fibronectin type III domain-containing protein [Candidatus Cloacimonadota bacterium]